MRTWRIYLIQILSDLCVDLDLMAHNSFSQTSKKTYESAGVNGRTRFFPAVFGKNDKIKLEKYIFFVVFKKKADFFLPFTHAPS